MDAFMKVDGIDGGSQSKDHKGSVDILSWNWGVTTQTSGSAGSGGTIGRPRAHELRVVHLYDLASPELASRAVTGKHLKEATLTVARSGASKDFLTVTMKDVVVTEVLAAGDEDDVSEEVAFSPAWISFDYAEPGHGGGASGRTSSFTWDIRSNKMG